MLSEINLRKSSDSSASGLRRSAEQRAIQRGVELVGHRGGALTLSHPGRLAGAAAVWMGGTFAVCYLLLPLARIRMGLSMQSAGSVAVVAASAALALVGLWMLATIGLIVRRPVIALEEDHRDRAVTATTGGLLVWSILHNVLPGLIPFGEMEAGELLSFLGANVIESALFGVMLASVATTVRGALSLGVLFQGALLLGSYAVMLSLG